MEIFKPQLFSSHARCLHTRPTVFFLNCSCSLYLRISNLMNALEGEYICLRKISINVNNLFTLLPFVYLCLSLHSCCCLFTCLSPFLYWCCYIFVYSELQLRALSCLLYRRINNLMISLKGECLCLCEISININKLFTLLLFVYFVYVCSCRVVNVCLLLNPLSLY